MNNYIGRRTDLKNRINNHLSKLTGKKEDYFSKLEQADLLELKTVLSDINNVLTLEMTIKSINWICDIFLLGKVEKEKIIHEIDQIKPNTKGFDINLSFPKKILGEIKCIIPVNKGNRYGAAQWNSILDDAIKLRTGTGKINDTSTYLKFIFLIDLGERTDHAINSLLGKSKATSKNQVRIDRHDIKTYIELFDNRTTPKFRLDKIYVVKIK